MVFKALLLPGGRSIPSRRLTKTWRIMRITAVLLLAACLQVSARTSAQVTLSGKNLSLEKVFSEIRRQAGYEFLYNVYLLEKAKPVSLDVRDAPVEQVLAAAFDGQPLVYTILDGKTIVVREKPTPIAPSPVVVAPPGEIHGHVMDSTGAPLQGASVIVKGQKKGVETDAGGLFMLRNVDSGAILIITFTGYETRQVRVGGKASMNIILTRSNDPLDEVHVIAYGTNTQRYEVGTVSVVTATTIEQQPVVNPLLALEGQVPGMTVKPTSGAPGAAVQVQVRGQNNLPSNVYGLTPFDQPLFIIDGVPFAPQNNNINQFNNLTSPSLGGASNRYAGTSPFTMINPLDIESITVLKDADATSIYGSQGSNGVVLITTKKGKAGKTTLDISVNTGPTKATRDIQMLNTQQYLQMRYEAFNNDGLGSNGLANYTNFADINAFDPTKYTDWFKQFFGGTANTTIAHATLSGGTINTTFLVGVGTTHQSYDFPGGFANDVYTLHSQFHHNSTDHRLTLEMGTDFSYGRNNSSGSPYVLTAYTLPPNFPNLRDAQGNLVWSYNGNDYLNAFDVANPYSYLYQASNLQNYNLNLHLQLNYLILPGLTIGAGFGYNRADNQEFSDQPVKSLDPATNPVSSASFGTMNDNALDITPQLNFIRRIGKGQFSALAGGEYKESVSASNQVSGAGYANDALLGSIDGAATVTSTDTYSQYKYDGVFGRMKYIWGRKYILDLNGRRDGSSKFGPGRQFGNFGSVGAGWIFSEEPFFKKGLSVISFGMLKINYGTSGGDEAAAYQYQPNWQSLENAASFQGTTPYSPLNLYNPDYSWNVNRKIDAGLSLGFLHDKLFLDLSIYRNRCSNQLVDYNLPIQTGFNYVVENMPATVQNIGWEITLRSNTIKTRDFSWSSNFNISGNNNKLVAFPGLATSSYSSTYVIGRPTTERTGYKYLGVNPTTGIFQFQAANGQPTYTPNAGLAPRGDEIPIGNSNASFFGGFSNTFTYKGFSLMVFLQFTKQIGYNYIYAMYSQGGALPGEFGNQGVPILNRWQKPGDVTNIERVTTGNNVLAVNAAEYFQESSGAYSDASYIRLQTLSFSWNVPKSYARKLGLTGASIHVNAQNLFTITPYQVLDPENAGQIYSFPLQKTITGGLSLNF